MNWELVGYIAKRRAMRDGWKSPYADYPDAGFPCGPPVEEICSVSNCIAREQESSREHPLGFYTDPAEPWALVPEAQRADYAMVAYRLGLIQFDNGEEEEIETWWELDFAPLPDSFVRLGWDAVEGGNARCFGCSPLSCNSGADIVRCPELNRYCLIDNLPAAISMARSFSITKPEPGPYCVVEVWRDTRTLKLNDQ